jgi:hypothetical protein
MRPSDILGIGILFLITFTGTGYLIAISTNTILEKLDTISHECTISPNPGIVPNHQSN